MMIPIANTIADLEQEIRDAEQRYGRPPNSVHWLAVSKRQPLELLIAAYQAGIRQFGESYLQEASLKMDALTNDAIEWHFIGPLQRNKTRPIAERFSWVHSLDSPLLATRLNEQRPIQLPPLNVCIQVNISEEPNKSGVALSDVNALVEHCLSLPHLCLRGLMAIPRHTADFVAQRDAFHQLHTCFDSLKKSGIELDTLSMGMSSDMEAAIAEGSTLLRIGTKLFGQRL